MLAGWWLNCGNMQPSPGGSVQHGLSAAIAFLASACALWAADKRCLLGVLMNTYGVARWLLMATTLVFSGCVVVSKPSPEELKSLDSPPPELTAKLAHFLPATLAWYNSVEAQLLPKGRPLSAQEQKVARGLGVKHPNDVRVVVLTEFPMPTDPELFVEAKRIGLGSSLEGGRTIGYAVMLKPRYAANREILTHELVHVEQQERMGRSAFLRRYLLELEVLGYARSPLELEAYARQSYVP